MNIIDIIFLIILIPMVIRGISKGFISQAVALTSLLLGTWLAYRVTLLAGTDLATSLDISPKAANILLFAVAFIAVWAILAVIGHLLKGLLKLALLEWLDKLLGGAFALVTTTLLCGLLVIMFDAMNDATLLVDQEILDESFFYHKLQDFARLVFPYLRNIIPEVVSAIPLPAQL